MRGRGRITSYTFHFINGELASIHEEQNANAVPLAANNSAERFLPVSNNFHCHVRDTGRTRGNFQALLR
jgi:hypothetical protein